MTLKEFLTRINATMPCNRRDFIQVWDNMAMPIYLVQDESLVTAIGGLYPKTLKEVLNLKVQSAAFLDPQLVIML